MSLSFYS